jgi:ribosomal protein L11 methyltransferase
VTDQFWCEIKVAAHREQFEIIAEILQNAGSGGVVYDDPAILQTRICECDEIFSEELLRSIATIAGVKAYFPVDDRLGGKLEVIRGQIGATLGETPSIWLRQIREADWAQAWKAYFKPEKIGKVVIKPSWEEYHSGGAELVVELDPGMAFGTGNHPTTRLCLELLQELVTGPVNMLDLGTGSGILAIAGAKLGARTVTASDIDPVAVRSARANVAANQVAEIVRVTEADLLQGRTGAVYDLVVANIIADIIVKLGPAVPAVLKKGGVFLASGIIAERRAQVTQVLSDAGLVVGRTVTRDGWVALVAHKGGPEAWGGGRHEAEGMRHKA